MPRRGQVTSTIRAQATPEERKLAAAIRAMCGCIRKAPGLGSQVAIAEKTGISQGALSEYLTAVRLPSEPTLSSLWDLMPDSMSMRRRPVPKSRAELAWLHGEADAARRLRKSADRTHTRDALLEYAKPRPAPLIIRNRCRKRHLTVPAANTSAAAVIATTTEPDAVLPVHSGGGDRQHTAAAEPIWAGLEEVRQHLKAGRESDAMTILSNAAHAADAKAVRNVVAACRSAGLDGAAHAVLTNASHREPEIILGIVGSLHDAENFKDAAILTRSAAQHARRPGGGTR